MQRINDFTLQSVIESEEPFVAPLEFFPDATQDLLDAHGHWMRPRFQDPDTGHLIFCFQAYILRTGRHTILIDSCIGNDKSRPARPTWHMRQGSFLEDLAAIGVRAEEVDFVFCTHLHADHIGWNTRLVDGRWVPTFANARYLIGFLSVVGSESVTLELNPGRDDEKTGDEKVEAGDKPGQLRPEPEGEMHYRYVVMPMHL